MALHCSDCDSTNLEIPYEFIRMFEEVMKSTGFKMQILPNYHRCNDCHAMGEAIEK